MADMDSNRENTGKGPGRPVGDREARRRELLHAGIAVIAEEGYAGTSLRKVAKRADCTTGAVTYYFANKEALVAAIIEQLFDQFDTILDPGSNAGDLPARFRQWITLNADSEFWLAQFQLLALARVDPAFAEIYQRRYAHYRDELTEILRHQQGRGEIRTDIDADLLADYLSALGDGWMMMLPIEPERFSETRLNALLGSLVTLIAPR